MATRIQAYVRMLSKPAVEITAAGTYGSTITSYRATLDGVTYTTASFTASKKLSSAGEMTLTVTVTDTRGRTATYTETLTVLDYSYPSIRLFKAERGNSDGSAAQVDGTNVRFSFEGGVVPLNNRNGIGCMVYYKLASDENWTLAETLTATSYNLSETDKVLTQTFNPLYSYDLKVRLQDYFYYVEQAVSIGTKGVIMDFLADGTGIAFGKVVETSGYAEFGWPLKLSEPLDIESGGTGASTAAGARSALGAVNKAGDTMTGNLSIQGYLYPSCTCCLITTAPRTAQYSKAAISARPRSLHGKTARATTAGCWKSGPRDMRTAWTTPSCCAWSNYRVFHAGMPSGAPVANGGTGATNAKAALMNLGVFYADTLPASGTDGQICLVPV